MNTDPPVIIPLNFGGTELYEGGVASATCVISQGTLPITISWNFNGGFLQPDNSRKIHDFGGRTSILTIEPLSDLHRGMYGCSASNSAGTDKAEAELVIHGIINYSVSLVFSACQECHIYPKMAHGALVKDIK